jgi:hypothetical protein
MTLKIEVDVPPIFYKPVPDYTAFVPEDSVVNSYRREKLNCNRFTALAIYNARSMCDAESSGRANFL